jgi:hypothetical protein
MGRQSNRARLQLEQLERRDMPSAALPSFQWGVGRAATETSPVHSQVIVAALPSFQWGVGRAATEGESGHDPVSSIEGPAAAIRLRRIVGDAVPVSDIKLKNLGQGKGTYTEPFINPDFGHEYQFTGTARFLGVVNARITGSIHTPGFILHGQAVGTFTFTNAKGSVTLKLVGPEQPGFSALPSVLSYTVEKGTGAYRRLTGSGTLTLKLMPSQTATLGGTFTLTIDSYSVPRTAKKR